MNTTSILTTGGSGFLGSVLTNFLKRDNKLFDIQDFSDIRMDITKPFEIDINSSFDIIIHAAGKAHLIPLSVKEEKAFYDVNYIGTINLCQAIDKLINKPKAFIFISTVAVYGLEKGEMITESYPLNGITPYAKSKILAEKYLIDWSSKNNIILSILRLPLVVAPNPPGNLGAMINGIKTGKYFSIGKADAKKSMVWGEDIAQVIPKLAETGGIYNLTDGYHPTFRELEKSISFALDKSQPRKIPLIVAKVFAAIGDLLGKRAPINTRKLNKITSLLTFNDYKANKYLGWKPQRVLDKIPEIV